MKKSDLIVMIQGWRQEIPERTTGNEENEFLAQRIASLVSEERTVVIELLREWLSVRIPQSERKPGDGVREGQMWVALRVAKQVPLPELQPDIESLIIDVRAGKTFLSYYADMIAKYLYAKPANDG